MADLRAYIRSLQKTKTRNRWKRRTRLARQLNA